MARDAHLVPLGVSEVRASYRAHSRQPRSVQDNHADNGTEFHNFNEIETRTLARFYFATPYHSWDRGANESTNGLIRQYLPKKSSMAKLTQQRCEQIAHHLNTRPRKRHGHKTPLECLNEAQSVLLRVLLRFKVDLKPHFTVVK